MLESSRDILNVVLAVGLGLLFMLFAWLMFNFIMIVRDLRQATKSIKEKINTIDAILQTLKDKIEKSASYFGLLVDLVSKLVNHIRENKKDIERPRKIVDPDV